MTSILIDGLLQYVFEQVIILINYLLSVLVNTALNLLSDPIITEVLNSVESISIILTFIGAILSVHQYFTQFDNTNSGILNLNPMDYIKPVIFAFVFSWTYIKITILVTNMLLQQINPLVSSMQETPKIEFSFEAVQDNTIFILIAFILVAINAWKIFISSFLTVGMIIINMILGVSLGYEIAQGDSKLVVEYFKKQIKTSFSYIITIFLFMYGIQLFITGLEDGNFLLGYGLILLSGNVDKIMLRTGLSTSTGAMKMVTSAGTKIAGGLSR